MHRPLLLAVLLAAAPALAQEAPPPRADYLPLERVAQAAEGVRAPRAALQWVARLAARVCPSLEGLEVPTTGRLRLGVVLVEFPDQARPGGFADPAHWERALFSEGSYAETATGQPACGSLRDYYLENSSGALQVEGRVFDWVRIPARRAELQGRPGFVDPRAQRQLFGAALRALREREGAGALEEVDALAFVVAGGWAPNRGGVLWPHSGVLRDGRRVWRYYLMHAGSERFEPIGVHCHELGHVLGVFDKYGVGPGTGLGQWCAMASGAHGARAGGVEVEAPAVTPWEAARRILRAQAEQLREVFGGLGRTRCEALEAAAPAAGQARPLHFCAVCKARLGWTRPRTIDPRSGPVRFFLTPVEEDGAQVARVLLDPRGRESVYLEYRGQAGFDADLTRDGVLVWRVGSPLAALRTFVPLERVELVPAHGVTSVDAALRDPAAILFPAAGVDEVRVRAERAGGWAVVVEDVAVEGGRAYVTVRAADR